jgi:pimeloyl-ACP methyl ester carboxylesterase
MADENAKSERREVRIGLESVSLDGHVATPPKARTLTIFVHGTGSSRHSPRNNYVAQRVNEAGFATLLFDLLTEEEDQAYATRFDIALLTERLRGVLAWTRSREDLTYPSVALFGASTGAAAAIRVAAAVGGAQGAAAPRVCSIISRGGRPDLADEALEMLQVPTLLVVGGADTTVLELNEQAGSRIPATSEIELVPGAGHLFEESGALDHVADAATRWLRSHCPGPESDVSG